MFKRYSAKIILSVLLICTFTITNSDKTNAQVSGSQPQEIKWLKVGALHQWFSNGGAEIEYGRRGRTGFQAIDQIDGLNWPGEYPNNKGVNVGKSLWIGTTNFTEIQGTLTGKNFPYKVVSLGRLNMNLGEDVFAEELSLIGKSDHPSLFVDDIRSSDLDFDDVVDEIDFSIPYDRIIINRFNTTIGISVTRNIIAFSQQYHNNYFIYEYTFKNTGIIDNSGEQKLNRTLTDVIFHFQYRYGFAGESYLDGWSPTGASWGLNAISDAFDVKHPGEFRAVWSYYGPHTTSPGVLDDVGLPRHTDGSILAGTNFSGVVVLHADKSSTDHSDDPNQPTTTLYMPSDGGAQGVNQYDENLMTRKYLEFMTAGHPDKTLAEEVGKDPVTGLPTGFAPPSGFTDAGGYAAAQGFGPYNLAPGDSVRIVVAEAVAGILNDRELVREIANKWFTNSGPFTLPDGSQTADRNVYKNTWVFSGRDSLFETFRRAIANFQNGYNIPQPPPPPDRFEVRSGGNRISLTWSNTAESWSNFNGYLVYRAEGRTDSTYNLIFSCDRSNAVNTFDDKTARRGFSYYYYIQTKDDGTTNNIQPGVPLVSSKYYTMTNQEAFLTRPAGTSLSEIRIVPNPYNIKIRDLQFGQNTPDRLAFYGLPPQCKIKIYTETGDLIETIEHTNGSGDELWHSLTSSNQLVVSGLYIAYFEVPEDIYDDQSGTLLFRKGENTFRKFIIIR